MARRKLSEAQERALMEDYYRWEKFNPDSESAEELAARHGISKPTLYNIKDRWEQSHGDPARQKAPAEAGAELEAVVRYLTEELVKARVEISQLQAIVQQNREWIEELRGNLGTLTGRLVHGPEGDEVVVDLAGAPITVRVLQSA